MSRTILKLLTRDGAIAVTFSNTLNPEQYEAIYAGVADTGDAAEMKKWIEQTAAQWGMTVIIDDN